MSITIRTLAFLIVLATSVTNSDCQKLTGDELQRSMTMQRAVLTAQNLEEIRSLLKAGFDVNSPISCGTYGVLDGAVRAKRGDAEVVSGCGSQA